MYDDDDNKGNTVAALDFGRGPATPTPKLHGMKIFLEGFACKLMMISFIAALMSTGLAILAIGLRAPMHVGPSERLEGIAGRHRLLGKLHAMNQTRPPTRRRCGAKKKYEEALLALRLPGGYNCRGYVWLADARIEAIFDTGATRNSIDKELLASLLREPRTQSIVKDIIPIEPLQCQSVSKASVLTIKQMVVVACTFKEGNNNRVTRQLSFCILENNSESNSSSRCSTPLASSRAPR